MSRKNSLLQLASIFGMLSLSGTATATVPSKPYPICSGEPAAIDVEAAQGAYQAGHVAFEEADYDRALLYWEDAFRRDCSAVKLLLSLARAYELAGNNARAALSLETYLARQDDPENQESLTKRIERLRTQTETKRNETPHNPEDSGAEQNNENASAIEDAGTHSVTKQPVWPIFVTGAGVALAIVGHSLIQSSKHKAEAYDCVEGVCPSDDATKEVESTQNTGLALAISGHAIGAAGGVLWYYLWTRQYEESVQGGVSIEPMIGPRFQGLRLLATF
jgi:tetratricopeptide (TPR) repeat protein